MTEWDFFPAKEYGFEHRDTFVFSVDLDLAIIVFEYIW